MERNSESGYALIVASIISLFTFSLLSIYVASALTSKQFTEADTQVLNSFIATESALNVRNKKVVDSILANPNILKDTVPQTDTVASCIDPTYVRINTGLNACQIFRTFSKDVTDFAAGSVVGTKQNPLKQYDGWTIVTDKTVYDDFASSKLAWRRLPAADNFPGAISQNYIYAVGSLGIGQSPNGSTLGQAVLIAQTDVRYLPVFQFTVFGFGDTTVVLDSQAGGTQNISGRYHANGNLYLARRDNTTDTIDRSWTIGQSLYLGAAGLSGSPSQPGYVASGNGLSVLPAENPSASLPYSILNNYVGTIKTAETGMHPLIVPSRELLRQKDLSGNIQDLYGKADIRIKMHDLSSRNIAFSFESMQSGAGAVGTAASCSNLSPTRENIVTIKCNQLTEGMLVSLHQPTLANNLGNSVEAAKYCSSLPASLSLMGSYSIAIQDRIIRALQIAISVSDTELDLSTIDNYPLDTTQAGIGMQEVHDRFDILLQSIPILTVSDRALLLGAKPQSIVAARQDCFIPAPIQLVKTNKLTVTGYQQTSALYDRREQKYLNALQVDIRSLALWNRDGVYATDATSSSVLAAFSNSSISSTDGLAYVRSPIDAASPNPLISSGLGAADRTEGGLIIHNSLDEGGGYPVDSVSLVKNYNTASLFIKNTAFIYSRGSSLPSALSVVADRALYTVGDWNSVAKQPSSVMADTVTILSGSCLANTDNFTVVNPNLGAGAFVPKGQVACTQNSNMSLATDTNFNAGILSGITPVGASNPDAKPIRYLEDWSGKRLDGLTSFVLTGAPLESSGAFVPPGTGGYGSTEYFRYPSNYLTLDLDFSIPSKLPPGTPRAIDIITTGINRKYTPTETTNITRVAW